MGALATPQAAVFDIPRLFRVATRQHLGHQALVVGRLVARMGVGKRVPVIGKDLMKDTPVPRGSYQHRLAPSWGHQLVAVKRLYHASAASSTPARPGPGNLSPASFILELWGLLDRKNEKSYAMDIAFDQCCQGTVSDVDPVINRPHATICSLTSSVTNTGPYPAQDLIAALVYPNPIP